MKMILTVCMFFGFSNAFAVASQMNFDCMMKVASAAAPENFESYKLEIYGCGKSGNFSFVIWKNLAGFEDVKHLSQGKCKLLGKSPRDDVQFELHALDVPIIFKLAKVNQNEKERVGKFSTKGNKIPSVAGTVTCKI